jgi:sugar-specific transcriptional regulator TrmB
MDALKMLGLNLYERKLYAALLARGAATAGELAELSNVPRSRTYDVLESLAEKGFVIIQPSKPIKYVAVEPEEALERVRKRLEQELEEMVGRIEEFKKTDAFQELKGLYSQGVSLVEPADLTGSLKGRYALYQRFENMTKNAEKTLDIITTEEGLEELLNVHSAVLQRAADKGVRIRILAPITEKNAKVAEALKSVAEIKDLNSAGFQKVPYGKVFLADRRDVVFSLSGSDTHPSQEVSFWTGSEHFAKNFAHSVFEMLWEHTHE